MTTNVRRAAEPIQLLIDPAHADWAASGLRRASVVNCSNIYTIEQADVARIIGTLSPTSMLEIDECLKTALELT